MLPYKSWKVKDMVSLSNSFVVWVEETSSPSLTSVDSYKLDQTVSQFILSSYFFKKYKLGRHSSNKVKHQNFQIWEADNLELHKLKKHHYFFILVIYRDKQPIFSVIFVAWITVIHYKLEWDGKYLGTVALHMDCQQAVEVLHSPLQ